MSEFLLPDVGEGLTEAEIVAWKVKVGDTVEINDVIVEIETAKSLVELPSPFEGTVQALLVPEGETVPVGTPIIAFGCSDGTKRGIFGPVLTRVPSTEKSLQVWDAMAALTTLDGFWELKRTRTERPELGPRPEV